MQEQNVPIPAKIPDEIFFALLYYGNAYWRAAMGIRRKRPKLRNGWNRRLETALASQFPYSERGKLDTTKMERYFNIGAKAIDGWISGRAEPSLSDLFKVYELTGYSIHWIITGSYYQQTNLPIVPPSPPQL